MSKSASQSWSSCTKTGPLPSHNRTTAQILRNARDEGSDPRAHPAVHRRYIPSQVAHPRPCMGPQLRITLTAATNKPPAHGREVRRKLGRRPFRREPARERCSYQVPRDLPSTDGLPCNRFSLRARPAVGMARKHHIHLIASTTTTQNRHVCLLNACRNASERFSSTARLFSSCRMCEVLQLHRTPLPRSDSQKRHRRYSHLVASLPLYHDDTRRILASTPRGALQVALEHKFTILSYMSKASLVPSSAKISRLQT